MNREAIPTDSITALLKGFVDKKMAAGVSAVVTKDGKTVYSYAEGLDNMETGKPFSTDAILRIYSMSKVVTAAAVMRLLDEGKLSLQDPASKYLPGFRDQKVAEPQADGSVRLVPVERDVTVFDLCTMTSGIPYLADGGDDPVLRACGKGFNAAHQAFCLAHPDKPDTVGFANMLGSFPLAFQPGDRWMYGYSCDVLGAIVEAASGMPYGEFLRTAIFDPLGMADTFFRVPAEKRSRVAKIYLNTPGGLLPKPDHLDNMDDMPYESGGAGLYSTVGDYTRFARMLLNKGELDGVRVLKEDSVRLMTAPHLTEHQRRTYDWDDCPGYSYGFAVRTMVDPSLSEYIECPGSFGWNGAAGTSVRVDPQRGLTVVFGTQLRPPEHRFYLPDLMRAVDEFLHG